MSLASVGDSLVETQCDHGPHQPDERMTEQTKSRKTKTKLPCQWLEDEGFEVTPAQGPANNPQALPDTAFLLKPNPLPRPTQFPIS
jgi:hypothetical protein